MESCLYTGCRRPSPQRPCRQRIPLQPVLALPRPGGTRSRLRRPTALVGGALQLGQLPPRRPPAPAGTAGPGRCGRWSNSQLGFRPAGPVRILTHLRYLGYCFNPISIYYCFGADRPPLEAIVAEVHNTPWGEEYVRALDVRTSPRDGDWHVFRSGQGVPRLTVHADGHPLHVALHGPRGDPGGADEKRAPGARRSSRRGWSWTAAR